MPTIQCFFCEPTGQYRQSLRRYAPITPESPCSCPKYGKSYHNAHHYLEDGVGEVMPTSNSHPLDDPRWPKSCQCGYVFGEADAKQLFVERLYRRNDTGELFVLREAPAGAMWYADWFISGREGSMNDQTYIGPDGHCLVVQTPGGGWMVDGRASNCTRKKDMLHKCWCRQGKVPLITVNKIGNTCEAGGGSIVAGNYHGFLRDGLLVDA